MSKLALHCRACIEDGIPAGQSARSWARLEAFAENRLITVRCVRHDADVAVFTLADPINARCEHEDHAS